MRNAFISWLCEKARKDDKIVLLTADLGYSVIEPFLQEFPGRFFNIGVAEQNMVGIAAGLASESMKPYTYSIGIFPTFRCAEQLRNDIDYNNLPVVSCTVGSGVTYGSLGYTHHAVQDLALMRSLPNMSIGTPADPLEVRAILDWQMANPSPLYLRMHKGGDPVLHAQLDPIIPGQWLPIYLPPKSQNLFDYCIVVAGSLAPKVVQILKELSAPIAAFSLPIWGQAYRKSQTALLKQYSNIITVEDHLLDGGFGSWFLENASIDQINTRIHPISLPSECVGLVASESTLLAPLLSALKSKVQQLISIS